jgi:hypothetical protein
MGKSTPHFQDSLTNPEAHHDIPDKYFWLENLITFRAFLFEILNINKKS